MDNEEASAHLKPILPPLGVKFSDDVKTTEKQTRLRIGTPAPQKKSPIPDDMDLDNFNGKQGNPIIKVESCKVDNMQRCKKLRPLPEDTSGGVNNVSRLTKKPQLQPILSPIFGDLNGNDIKKPSKLPDLRYHSETSKTYLPNKYAPLKPISKKSFIDE